MFGVLKPVETLFGWNDFMKDIWLDLTAGRDWLSPLLDAAARSHVQNRNVLRSFGMFNLVGFFSSSSSLKSICCQHFYSLPFFNYIQASSIWLRLTDQWYWNWHDNCHHGMARCIIGCVLARARAFAIARPIVQIHIIWVGLHLRLIAVRSFDLTWIAMQELCIICSRPASRPGQPVSQPASMIENLSLCVRRECSYSIRRIYNMVRRVCIGQPGVPHPYG